MSLFGLLLHLLQPLGGVRADGVLPPLVGVAVAARWARPLPALRAQHPVEDRGVGPLPLRLW